MKAVQVFLSYAREDEEKVGTIYQKLSQKGFKPWMDKKDILPGQIWKIRIQKAIRDSDFFLACLSANSINKRGFLQREIKGALDIWQEKLDSDIYLIPVRLECCDVPENLHDFQWVNIFEEDGWERLLKALEVGLKGQRGETTSSDQGTPSFEHHPVSEEPASGREIATPKEGPAAVRQRNRPPLVWIMSLALLVLLVLAAIVADWLHSGNGQPISIPKATVPLVAAQPTPTVRNMTPVLASSMPTSTYTPMPPTSTDTSVPPTLTLTDTPKPLTPTDTSVPRTPTHISVSVTLSPIYTPTPPMSVVPSPPTSISTATPVPQPDSLLPAPTILGPEDGTIFEDPNAQITLEWNSVKSLAPDEQYLIIIPYKPKPSISGEENQVIWFDHACTQQTSWVVNEHEFLLGYSVDGQFSWSVTLIRLTEIYDGNCKLEVVSDIVSKQIALSQTSEKRAFVWKVGAPSPEDDKEGGKTPPP